MAPAISIYSRGRFSINYYCCSCNPGELKTNKRMTTETDSLRSFKNSVFFPKVGLKIFQAYEGLGGGSGRQLTRALPYAPWCPPLPEGRRVSSVRFINGWEAKAGVRAEPGWGGGQVLDPDPDPDPAAPGPLSPSPGRQQRRAQGEARGAPRAPPRSPGNKGPPPPRAGRDLRGQRGAERPDAGGERRRPRAARFLQVSSPGALPGDRARSAARGERRRAGRSGGWGIKRCSSHP